MSITEIRTLPGIDAPERAPTNVTEAIARVIRDLPGISKDGVGPRDQGGYAYRGIEQITQAAAPLFARHGVVFVPRVTNIEVRELTVNNKPWTDTILTVDYRICGPGGPDDALTATVVGIGRDNSDKGANKALTQAFKYALIQTLCVADSKDDADGQTHEADAARDWALTQPDVAGLRERVDGLEPAVRAEFARWKSDQSFPWPWPSIAIAAMHAEIDRLVGGAGPASQPSTVGAGDSATSSADAETTGVALPASATPDPDEPYESWSKLDLVAACAERVPPIEHPSKATIAELAELLHADDRMRA